MDSASVGEQDMASAKSPGHSRGARIEAASVGHGQAGTRDELALHKKAGWDGQLSIEGIGYDRGLWNFWIPKPSLI